MVSQKRMSNGEPKPPVGPHPSTIRVSAQYVSQAGVEQQLAQTTGDAQERSLAEAKEDSLRLQGVQWIDVVRRALHLPVRTYTTACIYYHKFRLAHPPGTTTGDGYLWSDAAAASLLTACKMEDTLKKSREVLAASYNLKVAAAHEQVPADDPIFEQPSRIVIGLERLVLEAGSFDFRSRAPHQVLSKIARSLGKGEDVKKVHDLAWTALTDIYRTFAPLKHTASTLAFAALELAARLSAEEAVLQRLQQVSMPAWQTSRAEIMETELDSLDLYIQHTTSSILGSRYSLDDFLRIRLALNKECNDKSIPRYCMAPTPQAPTSQVQNGHPTPVSPPQPGSTQQSLQIPASAPEYAPVVGTGTLRFMLNPQLAKNERDQVESHFKEEWEEYEEEIEVPIPRSERPAPSTGPPSSRASSRDRRTEVKREEPEKRRAIDERRELDRVRERERDRQRPRDRERDRDGHRDRHGRRYDDERRRFDDRRYDERRYGEERRPREERRYRDERR
ncbi:hypothetical protein B0A48_07453 [Cryoendolithus antarcticus]|uniref:Cyclin N-terminal domain-containing protein n=1 Tax=Cryoendolithus antarcticus TaxID=1507870 RepID=A0A1V8T650_9PEZI|nr:hypothetical protein B0A48_07453 [Cryoendolithus antarcticus]